MDAKQEAFRSMLRHLAKAEAKLGLNAGAEYHALRGAVAARYPALGGTELEARLSRDNPTIDFGGRFLFAAQRKSDRSWQPILSVLHEPMASKVCIRAGFLAFDGGSKTRLVGFGYRFESPDAPFPAVDPMGSNQFWHAQPIRSMGGAASGSSYQLPVPEWLPDAWPAIAVDADDELSLLLVCVLAMHGPAEMERLATGQRDLFITSRKRMFRSP